MTLFSLPASYDKYLDFLPLFGVAVLTAFVVTPIVGLIARRFKVLGYPPSLRKGSKPSDYRHLEKQPTPLLGGSAVILPFLILVFANVSPSPALLILLAAVSILFIMGIIDDFSELSGKTQLIIQLIAAIALAASTIDLSYINNPFGGIINLDLYSLSGSFWGIPLHIVLPGDILLVGWILICSIAVKFTSGTDGLMEGNSFIAGILFFLLSVRFHNTETATASIIFAGLVAGFLFFNFYPAKIWSGSSGKSTYGFILAVLSVLSEAKLAISIIILLLPLLDFFWVIVNRFIVHRPKNPLKLLAISDRTHLHHRLLDLGLSERKVAFLEYILSGLLGSIALALAGTLKAFAFLIVLIFVVGILGYISFLKNHTHISEQTDSPEKKFSY